VAVYPTTLAVTSVRRPTCQHSPVDVIDARAVPREAVDAHVYLAKNRPVVVRLPGAQAWLDRWSPEAMCARFGGATIEVEDAQEVYVGERALRQMGLAATMRGILAGDPTVRWKGLEFLSRVPAMRADLASAPAPHRALLPKGSHSLRDTLWVEPGRTMSSLHHDGDFDNFNLQICGTKVFLLIPPAFRRHVYAYGSAESPVNPFAPDLRRFPAFASVPTVVVTLQPGEALLIPKYWWHCVYAAEAAVNLSTHFAWPGELRPWHVLSGTPLVHRSLTTVAAALKRRQLHGVARMGRALWHACYTRVVPRVAPQPRGEPAPLKPQAAAVVWEPS
jgi:hypothetical protein